jgi:hypothetical protein
VAARTLALVAGAALLVGLVAGLAIGRATKSEPSLADKVADLRSQLRPAREGIEILPNEYEQAVRGGRVIAPTEYDGARGVVKRARAAVRAASSDLRAYDASRADDLDHRLADLESAVQRRADPAEVTRAAAAARTALSAFTGQPSS